MKQSLKNKVALITGASSGIGRALCVLLACEGVRVYGGCRAGALRDGLDPTPPQAVLAGGSIEMLRLDVTEDASAEAFVAHVLSREARVDILVNCAGNGLCGAVEDCTAQDAAAQMAVNYFGVLRMLGLVLPHMRAAGQGMVVNIGSVGGAFAIPFQTLYSSSKAALALLTDGLRLELRPFGVAATLIEPGDVATGFTNARRKTPRAQENTAYADAMAHAVACMERDERGGMQPEVVARAALRMIQKGNPPARCVVGAQYRIFVFCKRLLPYALVERLLAAMYLPRSPRAGRENRHAD